MTASTRTGRQYPVGAEWNGASAGVDFRVWAPKRKRVEVVFEGGLSTLELANDGDGYFRGASQDATPGARYRFRLDGGERLFPDPASRFQPDGPHGVSEVIDRLAFRWNDQAWKGVTPEGQILYELHLGTFTPEGTWAAAARELPALKELGITVIEVMPIAEFPGQFGWGYDGVDLFAPEHVYGRPDDAKRFVDAAHALGLGVILDVVYNHFGPDGNYLSEFSDTYFTKSHVTDWGAAINYYDVGCQGVRDLVVANAGYWVREFHFDGLRLDATQNIYDHSKDHILAVVGRAVRAAAGPRATLIAAENEAQEAKLVRTREHGGHGLDALWNDDFHHTARVALTGKSEAYYTDYGGTSQEFVSAAKWGYLFQGQHYVWQKQRRGEPALDLGPANFHTFLENHDQVANSTHGARLCRLASRGRHRALIALMLLGPQTPLLFQGEEFASSKPFVFFADHNPDLAKLVHKGRGEFMQQFPSVTAEVAKTLSPPHDRATFERCKLDFAERDTNRETLTLYRDLIALRKRDSVFAHPRRRGVDGAVLAPQAFLLRFFGEQAGDDRLLLVNLGPDLDLARAPEPLLAEPSGASWHAIWSTEDPRYGGDGVPPFAKTGILHLPGESALVLAPGVTA